MTRLRYGPRFSGSGGLPTYTRSSDIDWAQHRRAENRRNDGGLELAEDLKCAHDDTACLQKELDDLMDSYS
jgi:hypothetical protein